MTTTGFVSRSVGRVAFSLGLAWIGASACGASTGDLFEKDTAVDGPGGAGAGEGGEPGATGGAPTPAGGSNSGGRPPIGTGGSAPTGGRPAMGTGGDGGAGGDTGTPGNSCEDVLEATAAELASIQACQNNDECGQVLKGTSCGCTRDLVARLDADPSKFEALRKTEIDGELCDTGLSTCDCPDADGFACVNARCSWNYKNQGRACTTTAPGQLCLQPSSNSDAADPTLQVGDRLRIQVQPTGCHSSSCTEPVVTTCSLKADGDDFVAEAEFCLADSSVSGGGCTADCGGGGFAECQSEIELTAGQHTVRLGDLSLTFTVPSSRPLDSRCAGSPF